MLELTPENALDYLRQRRWAQPGPARIEWLSGGVSNAVLRVEQAGRLFVVKQSRPQLRTRDAWFSDVARVYREQEVMQALRPLLPAGVVPEVLFSDRPNYVFAMSHAPPAAVVWKAQLLAGEVDLAIGHLAGVVLGRIHEQTGRAPDWVKAFADSAVFAQLRVDPFYRRIQDRCPDVAEAIAPLIDSLLSRREALCHGDYSPKNMLVLAGSFTLVDYETAYFGDPTMDLGFFLSHLLLKACKRSAERQRYFALTRAFWRGYQEEVRFRDVAELQRRSYGHLGACLLARIDGTSPIDYLPEEAKRSAVRRLGRGLLLAPPAGWEAVLDRFDAELQGVAPCGSG
jgi:5-methylthioribose kinase